MAEEVERSAEDRIGDMIFGAEEAPEEPVEAREDEEATEVAEDEESPSEEDTEAQEASEEETEEEYAEIEIDGEVLQVPAKYKDYFLRQQDYTQKTQELAQQRKEYELLQQQAQAQKAQYDFVQENWDSLLEANQSEALIKQYKDYLTQNIDSLSATDVQKIQLQIEQIRDQHNELNQTLQGKWQEAQQAQQQSFRELLNKGTEVLRQKIPNWGEQAQKQVREYALKAGFSEQELNSVFDPRQVEVLWKAAQYDNLKQGAKPAVKKVQQAPTIKPKARNPMPEDTKKYLSARKKLKSAKDNQGRQRAAEEVVGAKLGRLGI